MKIQKGMEENYKIWYENNLDPYGHACFTYAERWAELLEKEIEETGKEPQKVIIECAEQFGHKADTEGITGYMYGCAVSILAQCWEHGEELRKWHNKQYDHDGDGVVNPAVITIK
jgi:hypothetical protein